jgi:uncharacterized protein (TIGR03083 family)
MLPVLDAFAAETGQLARVMLGLAPEEFARPSPCPLWTVAGLLGHVATAVGRLPGMLADPAPPRAEVSAAGYYRADARFSPGTNEDRVATGTLRAAAAADALALAFDADRRRIVELCRREPADRVVRTRHGDAMLLTDFLVTRVVEVGVHGLDLADGLGRPAWLTGPAAAILTGLFFADDGPPVDADLLRGLTGRRAVTPEESATLERRGVRRLTLG